MSDPKNDKPTSLTLSDLLPEGKLSAYRSFLAFLDQRKRIMDNPWLILKQPDDAKNWLDTKASVKTNIKYIVAAAGLPKLLLPLFGGKIKGPLADYLVTIEWILPIIQFYSVGILKSWLRNFTAHTDESIAEFEKIFLHLTITKPFWFYVAFGAVAWIWLFCASGEDPDADAIYFFVQLNVLLVPGIWLLLITLPMEAASTAAKHARVYSQWLMGISFLVNYGIYFALQMMMYALVR